MGPALTVTLGPERPLSSCLPAGSRSSGPITGLLLPFSCCPEGWALLPLLVPADSNRNPPGASPSPGSTWPGTSSPGQCYKSPLRFPRAPVPFWATWSFHSPGAAAQPRPRCVRVGGGGGGGGQAGTLGEAPPPLDAHLGIFFPKRVTAILPLTCHQEVAPGAPPHPALLRPRPLSPRPGVGRARGDRQLHPLVFGWKQGMEGQRAPGLPLAAQGTTWSARGCPRPRSRGSQGAGGPPGADDCSLLQTTARDGGQAGGDSLFSQPGPGI